MMMMQSIRRAGFLAKNQLRGVSKLCNGFGSIAENVVSESSSGMGFAAFSFKAMQKSAVPTQRAIVNSSFVRHFSSDLSHAPKVIREASGLPVRFKEASAMQRLMNLQSSFQPAQMYGMHSKSAFSARSFSSKASESTNRRTSEAKKEISTIDDTFNPLTSNIPQKPVTFTEGASYSIIILAGLGVAAAAAYAVFKELIFQPKEYKIYGKALDRIQNDGQVRVRIGSPITGYGSESRNRAARQRIPNRTWTDEDGVEHIEVNFYIRGPHGAGKVYTEMFKDKEDKQWKFTYLIVDINSPSQVQLMLESYVPA